VDGASGQILAQLEHSSSTVGAVISVVAPTEWSHQKLGYFAA
jgi:hypothetical protein